MSSPRFRIRAAALAAAVLVLAALVAAAPPEARKANYDLASRWTPAKVGKLVFDTSVAPHWLETADRFWYTYETAQGRKWYLVDPAARSKKPLFDNAKMAAQLTRILLVPYDAQHLPIKTIKFVNKDTAVQFEIEVPKDNDILVNGKIVKASEIAKEEETKDLDADKEKEKEKEQDTQKVKGKEADKPKEPEKKTKVLGFTYELATGRLSLIEDYKVPDKRPRWASVSPDGKTVVFARGHNLFLMDAESFKLAQKKADDKAVKEVQLTEDGEEHYSYARTLNDEDKKEFQKDEKDRKDFRAPAGMVVWSKDSRKIALVRSDERKVADLWVINSLADPRPTLETYRYEMPGEENQPQPEILVLDLASKAKVKVKADKFKDPTFDIFTAPRQALDREKEFPPPAMWLADGSDRLYFGRQSRDLHGYDVCVADTATGEVKVLIEERLNTYVEAQDPWLLGGGKEMIWWSERDGWGHYYLYDGDGRLKAQLTSGEFVGQGIARVDEKARVLYFLACGREPGEDPYYTHLYRVGLDGSGLRPLDKGDASHQPSMNDSARFFVDNFSRVDAAPKADLRDTAGNLLLELEAADVTALLAAGFKYPEPFKVKADDGITDLYGVMYKPFDFDANAKYPIIAYVYPGPQTESVSKTFVPRSQSMNLAQLGFVVIEVGNRGGHPSRSKWYHNYGYGNLRDYGLADKKRAIEQLAALHPFIDIDRVGIYGHSGGGFMSTAAMLVYPDFFKVAVSSSGNHENNVYNRWWSEKHHGVKEITDKDGGVKFEYAIEKNSEIAKNLKGRLLITTGDIDNNVHPANTLRLAAALIKANKRFDFFVFPGQRHGYGDMGDYWFWLRADYFAKWLLGDFSQTVDLVELQREKEQKGK
ncbi:MAG: DPP IV N-terminal domain-containing protein [Candidatus Aminicenantes bacterium]|nr:DPP IV N-terminal domain-containing protein [Candidatus Aminicenantes bacterium]NLH76922.1 prolyl oligopeptidase family serine peptidase [Acidobacteriota bacterium]